LIPAGTNYIQELHGRRLAEALRSLGLVVDLGNLGEQIEENYDLCVLTSIAQMLFDHELAGGMTDVNLATEEKRLALAAIRSLRSYCRAVACCLVDCTDVATYEEIQRYCQAAGIDAILDLGFHTRSALLAPSVRSLYHFLPNGLTPSEQEAMNQEKGEDDRPIPWVFIGQASARRVSVVNNLITHLDPCGFVYMPNEGKVASKTVQQLNQRQYETVLRKCRYHIWYSQHQHFCLESERFRLSLLAGCVPIKVVPEDQESPSSLPFNYLVARESEAADRIRQFNFHEIRRRLRVDFLAFPSLADGLLKFLVTRSLLPGRQPSMVKSQAA
jgi:hypothetical protein